MHKSYRFLISALFLGAYLLSACTGVVPQQDDSPSSPSSSQSAEAVFTGTVESMDGTQWLISGQLISVDDFTSVDSNIQVGDTVKVEASVSADGSVVALKIETSGPDDVNANDNAGNDNGTNANDDNTNANDNGNDNSNANSNDTMGVGQEAFGVVEALTADAITIDGVTYSFADFTEFKNVIAVGDQVKIHVIVNADGTFTIREIEQSTGAGIGDDNGNSNDNNSNLNGNDDNSNDDDSHDDNNSNSNSNDDDEHDDDNSNSSNSNDD